MTVTHSMNDDDPEEFPDELRPGDKLLGGQYTIDRFLASGGFGITYLATDSLDRCVVIKECFPQSFCRRKASRVLPRLRSHQETYQNIIGLFMEEARKLALLEHPNIVGVHQVFEDHNTAYMVLEYVEGQQLLSLIEDGQTINPKEFERLTLKLLDAVGFIHAKGILHRDIAPDNILITPQDEPVLIDFGAARETTPQELRLTDALKAVKDGYSPYELYVKNAEQFPSSDLYALAASLYHMMTKQTPPNAQERMIAIAGGEADPYSPVGDLVDGYTPRFLAAIDKALEVLPKNRLQSAEEWRDRITNPSVLRLGQDDQPETTEQGVALESFAKAVSPDTGSEANPGDPIRTEVQSLLTALREESVPEASTSEAKTLDETPAEDLKTHMEEPPQFQTAPTRPRRAIPVAIAALVALAVLGVGIFFAMGRGAKDIPTALQNVMDLIDPHLSAASFPTDNIAVSDASDVASILTAPSLATEDVDLTQTPQTRDIEKTMAEESHMPPIPTLNPLAQLARPGIDDQAPIELSIANDNPAPPPPPRSDTKRQTLAAKDGGDDGASDTLRLRASNVVVRAPGKTAIDEIENIADVQTANVIAFPVLQNFDDPNVVLFASGDFGAQIKPGQKIISVNGIAISSLKDIPQVISETSYYTAGEVVEATLGLAGRTTGVSVFRDVSLPTVKETTLANSLRFQTSEENGAWVTTVINGSGSGDADLRPGDHVTALMPADETIDGPDSIARILRREIEKGRTKFDFSVNRGDKTWLVSMVYAPETKRP